MFHADVDVFHGVVGVWVVEHQSLLDLLVVHCQLLHLRPVAFYGRLKVFLTSEIDIESDNRLGLVNELYFARFSIS